MGNFTIFQMFENPRRGRQVRNFTTNVPKILDLKSSSEQIFSRKLSLGAPERSQASLTYDFQKITTAQLSERSVNSSTGILCSVLLIRIIKFHQFMVEKGSSTNNLAIHITILIIQTYIYFIERRAQQVVFMQSWDTQITMVK